jgi:hypothetical protein
VALRRVLEVAEPRPPRWRTCEEYPDYKFDEVLGERAYAIHALAYFQRIADEVVPVLIVAFDTFEEFDPDWSYNGEHERVCAALAAFGPRAAPAVPRLVRYLEEWLARPRQERKLPKDVFGLLAAIGPAAAGALPTLEQLRTSVWYDDSPPNEFDPDDPLDQAILSILKGAED